MSENTEPDAALSRREIFQAQQAADQYILVNSRNAERGDLLTLKQILLISSGANFDIIKPETILLSDSVAPFREVEQFALKNRPKIQSGQLNIHIAEMETAKARAGYLPFLSAGGTLNTGYASGQEAGYSGQLNSNFNQQAGLTLTVPIYTKRVVKTQVEEAKIAVSQAGLDLDNTRIFFGLRAYLDLFRLLPCAKSIAVRSDRGFAL